jgi:hypothetical protein
MPSLLRYPANHPTRPGDVFSPGDTVWIRVLVDPQVLVATFEPSGLAFNPVEPAELEIRYGRTWRRTACERSSTASPDTVSESEAAESDAGGSWICVP